MYRLYLLCVTNAVVFGNSDETKYIDLLPEAEKQEFLNRVARRIIEEIQGKDIPEQSHAEVSDDQLNAHHAYVQDLIKEESENLKNERRDNNDKESVERKVINEELEKDNVADEYNNPGITDNSQHIDLTLRNDAHRDKNKISDDSSFSVIPVKVVYDQGDISNTQSPINSNQVEPLSTQPHLVNFSEEKQVGNQSNTNSPHKNSEVSEYQTEIISENGGQDSTTDTQPVTNDLVESTTEIEFGTDTTMSTDFGKGNKDYENSLENTKSSTNIYISSNKTLEDKNNNSRESDVQLDHNKTLLPSRSDNPTQSNTEKSEFGTTRLSTIYVTTVKSTDINLNQTHEIRNVIITANISQGKGENKIKSGIVSDVAKKLLRKGLQISEEHSFEKDASHESYNRPKLYKNNNIKQYYVYEVPEEKPVFVEAKNSNENEQPYVVPIYNFAPNKAYYNARNHYGLNNDEKDIVTDVKFLENYDKKLYLRSGFEIDLNPKNLYYRNDARGQLNRYYTEHPRRPYWENIMNSKHEYNPNFINQKDLNLRQIIKRDNSFKQFGLYGVKKDSMPKQPKIPSTIKYIPLGQIDYDDVLRRKKHRMKKIHELSLGQEKDRIRALKTFFYQQQKFGYLPPSTHRPVVKRGYKRVFEGAYGLKFDSANRRESHNSKAKNFELDYYFGTYKSNNKTDDIDSGEEYSEFDNITTVENDSFYDIANKNLKNYSMKRYRMAGHGDGDGDCEYGCIEMDLEILADNFDNYLESLVNVLKDMIYRDNTDLVDYDWLLSTVNLESALKKLIYLTETIKNGGKIHPLDSILLNYIVYLHLSSSDELKNTIRLKDQSKALQNIDYIVNSFLRLLRRRIALPKNGKKKSGYKIRNPLKFWYRYYIRDGSVVDDMRTRNDRLRIFYRFLKDLQDNLLDLHDALKHIAIVTTYRNQNWYRDLKNIYLKFASQKQLLQVILHLAASRLFSSIEYTAKKVEEDELYKDNNEREVRRLRDEFLFVLRILERIKKIN